VRLDPEVLRPDLEYFSQEIYAVCASWPAEDDENSPIEAKRVLPPLLRADSVPVAFCAQKDRIVTCNVQ
jgi:hypothetical protein